MSELLRKKNYYRKNKSRAIIKRNLSMVKDEFQQGIETGFGAGFPLAIYLFVA